MKKNYLFLLGLGLFLVHKPLCAYDLFDNMLLASRMYKLIDDGADIQKDYLAIGRSSAINKVNVAGKVFAAASNTESLLLRFAESGLEKDKESGAFVLPFSSGTKKMYYGTMGLVAVVAAFSDAHKIRVENNFFKQCFFFICSGANADKARHYLSSLAEQLRKENAVCDQEVQTEESGESALERKVNRK